MDEFKLFTVFEEAVDVDETSGEGAGTDGNVLASTHDKKGLIALAGEADSCNGRCGFIVAEVDLLESCFGGDGINDMDARGPVTLSSRVAEIFWWELDPVPVDNGLTVE